MNQLQMAWDGLDSRRRMATVVAIALALLAMAGVWRMAQTPDMALLYAGLEPATAGEVIAALESRGLAYQVRGGAIYIDSAERDATRLSLAAEGLPATGGVGYELLDTMTGFGTTAQMFDAAYWRAKEGELARTILASREIRAARVHIATPSRQPFSRAVPVTASVTVTPAAQALSPQAAEAIRFLVSSAVAGLDAADVAVIDSANGVVPPTGGTAEAPDVTGPDPRATALKANLERLLAARVGPGKAIVEVHIDADMDSQKITERVVDPASRVAISQDLEERTEESAGTGGGAVTVASNLPDGDVQAEGQSATASRSETRERQNFEISETRRERIIQPGQIRRISVAVMIDGISSVASDGTRSWNPRPEDEMQALRALVESAIGFDEGRGDRVTIQTLEFPEPPALGTPAGPSGAAQALSLARDLTPPALLALVALLLGFFVVRPLLTAAPALPAPGDDREDGVEVIAPDALSGEETAQQIASRQDAHKIKNLRTVITERSDDSAEVLRRWIEAPDPGEGTA